MNSKLVALLVLAIKKEVPHKELNMKNINSILDEVKDYFEEQLFEDCDN